MSGIRSTSRLGAGTRLTAFVLASVCAAVAGCGDSDKPKKASVQTIAVLRPPPPPPPPKPEEKPPEPEIKKEEVKLPDPEPQKADAPDEPPPSQDLGVDAEGGAGSDGFGLQGRPGGRDITTIGDGGGGGGKRMQFSLFERAVAAHLQEELSRRERLRQSDYRILVRLWLTPSGSVEKVELASSSGNRDLDELLRTALADVTPFRESVPADMPQPIKIRLTSRGAG